MRKAFKYRLYPTHQQAQAMDEMLDTHRHLYNRALAARKAAWEEEQRTVRYGEQAGHLKDERAANPSLAKTNISSGALPEVPKTLADRIHVCSCGLVLDRDENAARNILQRALGRRVQAPTPPIGDVA